MNTEACIFPAFVIKYLGEEIEILENHNIDFKSRLTKAEKISRIKLSDFDIHKNNLTEDELKTQIISYVFSCCYSDLLNKYQNRAKFVSGLSMGIYAAFYHIRSLSFEDGIILIKDIYNTLRQHINGSYCMLSVIGLELKDLLCLTKNNSFEIVIKNGEFSYILAGKKEDLNSFQTSVAEEGALHTHIFKVNIPYHSSYISPTRKHIMAAINAIPVKSSLVPYVSMVNQATLLNEKALKREIIRNLYENLDFNQTIIYLNSKGINQFKECGPGNSLTKSSKFITAPIKFISINKWYFNS